jgi:rubrerythrin
MKGAIRMDILQFAIDMELDGERYYREQAIGNEGNSLAVVFATLAEDEARHAKLLISKRDGQPYTLTQREKPLTVQNVFAGAADFQASVKELPDQPELYQTAQAMEQRSIDLYRAMQGKAENAAEAELLAFLIGEEKEHDRILTELYHYANRPREWVESAEFGVREEY